MKKIMLLVLSLTITSTLLFGCQTNESSTINSGGNKLKQQSEVEEVPTIKINGQIKEISISKTNGSNKIVLEDSSIETLKTIIMSGIKVNGIADMTNPEYYMNIIYEDGNIQYFHLWIHEKGETSTLMNTEDTHTAYTVGKEMTEKLIEFIK
ncbi:hypothetical protein H9635_03875 [Solibacillus sp. A46]|uniref:YhfM-like domain-containing protein n=1 Tax=Solibacillus faecavium TaxID=2762221 RepID=A0ABR8XVA2_9BACL|nr:hypothetical protein [Solibacillus faecavium]MBD8035867.1 hypothetical protein [Solibacillus faecavium]